MTKQSQGIRDLITRFAEPIRGARHGRTNPTRPADGSENARRRQSRTTERTQREPAKFATTHYETTTFNKSNKTRNGARNGCGCAPTVSGNFVSGQARPSRNTTLTGLARPRAALYRQTWDRLIVKRRGGRYVREKRLDAEVIPEPRRDGFRSSRNPLGQG